MRPQDQGAVAYVRVYNYAAWKANGTEPPISRYETASRGLKNSMRREMKRLGTLP